MSSIGTGYDLSASTYSPEGRVFQIEYAGKAVDKSGTSIGVRVSDGVVLGVEKLILSKMLVPGSNRRVFHIAKHCGLAATGAMADARQIVNQARDEAKDYKGFYGDPVPLKYLTERVAGWVQAHTLYASARPFGVAALIGGVDANGPQLYMIEHSGVSYGYYACAVGKGREQAKTELEKLKLSEMTAREAVNAIAKIIYEVHDEIKDKEFELELSWVCTESGNVHQLVPKELVDKAIEEAKAALASDGEDDSDDDDDDDDAAADTMEVETPK